MQNLMENNSNYSTTKNKKAQLPFFNKKYTALFLFCCVFVLCIAATPPIDYTLFKTIPVEGKNLATDVLKNVYVVTNKNQVQKYDSTGTLTAQYDEKRYGDIAYVDATSPFNVLVFFKNKSTVLMLDNAFNTKTLYKFSTLDINEVSAACLSSDNYVWFYDQDANKIKKINSNYEIIHESLDLDSLLGEEIRPNFMIERDGFVFLNIPKMGIIAFDRLGNYYTSYPIANLVDFQILNRNIVYYQDGKLQLTNMSEFYNKSVNIPQSENTQDVVIERERLFLLTDKELQIYTSK